ncbi:hypothetical protein MANES_13G118700v8 [Manihot esculenta]|uniref:Uncharacterized protein n=1 Tax=Manihot esculenta TaxID=3983 RepID=A0A2C9US79_MANES|nr:hypothetical protein MANES_13G118700v8 [Manihot esculenta]
MNAQVIRETETIDGQGNVDCRSSAAGQCQEIRNVQVTHQPHPKENSKTSGGVLSNAAASIASTLESARDAIIRN